MSEKPISERVRCPECGSECLDIHVDSKGEIFYNCMCCDPDCDNLFTKESGVGG